MTQLTGATTNPAPRIPPLDNPGPEVRETLAKTVIVPGGPILNIFRTMAHNGRLLKRMNVLGGYFLAHGMLSAHDRELAILRTAWLSGSAYEWGQHVLIGKRAGLPDNVIDAVASEDAASVLGVDDAALVRFVDELVRTADVSDDEWRVQQARWSEAELIELVTLVGYYRMIAGFLNAVRVSPEGDLPGWPAD